MDEKAARPGQLGAHTTIKERAILGHRHTAIVQPTGYGKSNTIRSSGIELHQEGVISCSLVLSPNKILRDQMGSRVEMEKCIRLLGLNPAGVVVSTLKNKVYGFTNNGEMFVSATMQLVEWNVDFFGKWVESIIARTGKPPMVFVDESHTGSEKNEWGRAYLELTRRGA